jgi:hypothetical protein
MSDQQSKKAGVASTSRKLDRARHGFEPMPATQPVAGAFGAEDEPPADELTHATAGHGRNDVGAAPPQRRKRQPSRSR